MWTFVAFLQAAALAATPVVDGKAEDVVGLFMARCVTEAGNPKAAHELDSQPEKARPLATAQLESPLGLASEGWVVRGDHDGWAMLYFVPSKRTCAVVVRESDAKDTASLLDDKIRSSYATMGMPVAAKPVVSKNVKGVSVEERSWIITAGAHEIAIVASFGERPADGRQHLMTFTLLH